MSTKAQMIKSESTPSSRFGTGTVVLRVVLSVTASSRLPDLLRTWPAAV